jgi:hypothetical protein
LQRVIADLWEHILRVVIDLEVLLDSCADMNEEDGEGGRRKDSKENGHSEVAVKIAHIMHYMLALSSDILYVCFFLDNMCNE